jgi:hypothetical protein
LQLAEQVLLRDLDVGEEHLVEVEVVGSESSANGRRSTPGDCMSMIRTLMPLCLGTSGSVRTKHMHQSAWCAPDVHTFCPLTTKWSPSSTRAVESAARSLPAPGSLMPRHHAISAAASGAGQRSCCSGVP